MFKRFTCQSSQNNLEQEKHWETAYKPSRQIIFQFKDTEIELKKKNQDQAHLLADLHSLQITAWTDVDSCMDEQKSTRQWGLTTKPWELDSMIFSQQENLYSESPYTHTVKHLFSTLNKASHISNLKQFHSSQNCQACLCFGTGTVWLAKLQTYYVFKEPRQITTRKTSTTTTKRKSRSILLIKKN